MRTVAAGRGLQWIIEAAELSLRNPAMFWGMGAVVGLIAMLPILNFAMVVIAPALIGGIAYAAREQVAGRPVEFPYLFQAFRDSSRLGPMLLLCLPGIVAGVVVVVLIFVFLGGAILAAFSGADGGIAAAGAIVGVVVIGVLALAIGAVVFALQFFAIPRVMFDGVEPFAAMRESLATSLANVGAVVLYALLMLVLVIAITLLSLSILFVFPPLVSLVSGTVAYTLGGLAIYRAYADVYGDAVTSSVVGAGSPPTPPPA